MANVKVIAVFGVLGAAVAIAGVSATLPSDSSDAPTPERPERASVRPPERQEGVVGGGRIRNERSMFARPSNVEESGERPRSLRDMQREGPSRAEAPRVREQDDSGSRSRPERGQSDDDASRGTRRNPLTAEDAGLRRGTLGARDSGAQAAQDQATEQRQRELEQERAERLEALRQRRERHQAFQQRQVSMMQAADAEASGNAQPQSARNDRGWTAEEQAQILEQLERSAAQRRNTTGTSSGSSSGGSNGNISNPGTSGTIGGGSTGSGSASGGSTGGTSGGGTVTDGTGAGTVTGGTGGGGGSVGDPEIPASDGPLPEPGPAVSSEGVSASLRWFPVDTSSCPTTPSTRGPTLDLYVRTSEPELLTAVDVSTGGRSIRIDGGGVQQETRGGGTEDFEPTASLVAADPCVAFDSYIDFGTATGFFFLTEPNYPPAGGNGGGVTFATGFFGGVAGQRSSGVFGDSGYYVRIARLTLDDTVQSLGGSVQVTFTDNSSGNNVSVVVTVPDCASCLGLSSGDDGSGGEGNDDADDDAGDDPADDGEDDAGDGSDDEGDDDGDQNGGGSPAPDPGDDGGDDNGGDVGDGEDGNEDEEEDDEEEEPTDDVAAIWVTIDNGQIDCGENPFFGSASIEGFVTRDLYLRVEQPHDVLSIGFGVGTPDGSGILLFDGETPFQSFSGSNVPPDPTLFESDPCLEFDSYFAIGSAPLLFLSQPSSVDWGLMVEALYAASGTTVQASSRPDLFPGDDGFYVRILRVTTTQETVISGSFVPFLRLFGTGDNAQPEIVIPVVGG